VFTKSLDLPFSSGNDRVDPLFAAWLWAFLPSRNQHGSIHHTTSKEYFPQYSGYPNNKISNDKWEFQKTDVNN